MRARPMERLCALVGALLLAAAGCQAATSGRELQQINNDAAMTLANFSKSQNWEGRLGDRLLRVMRTHHILHRPSALLQPSRWCGLQRR